MPKASAITREMVFRACDLIQDQGERVSFERVYIELGRKGSARVVNTFISEWQNQQNEKMLPGLPDRFIERWRQAVVAAWDGALEIAHQELADRRAELESELAAGRAAQEHAVQEASMQVREANARLLASQSAINETTAALAEERSRADSLTKELAQAQAELAAAVAKNTAYSAELESNRRESEAVRTQLRDQVDRLEAAYQGLERRSLGDIEAARTEIRTIRAEFEKRLATAQKEADKRQTTLAAKADSLAVALASAKEEARQQGLRADRLSTDNRNIQEQLAVLRAELATLGARAAAVEEYRAAETDRANRLQTALDQSKQRTPRQSSGRKPNS